MATHSRSIMGTSNKVNKFCSCNVMENHQNASKLVIGRLAKRTVLLWVSFPLVVIVILSPNLGLLEKDMLEISKTYGALSILSGLTQHYA